MQPGKFEQFSKIGLSLILTALWLCTGLANLTARTLTQDSPFLPPALSAKQDLQSLEKKKPNKNQGRFILRGVSKIGSIYLFSILDQTSGKSKWVESGVRLNGFVITGYDPTTRTVDYEWDNQNGTIQLTKADEQPIQLNFISGPASASASSNPYAPLKSSASRTKGQVANQGNSQVVSSEKVIFRKRSTALFSYSPEPFSGPIEKGYASEDLFADIGIEVKDGMNSTGDNATATDSARFKISRRNSVHNPTGKKPDHLSYDAWITLKNSQ